MTRPPIARARPLASAMLLALLGGCAVPTTAAFDAQIAGLIGQPEADVVARLGVPVRTYDVGGRRFLQYESRRLVGYPGAYPLGYGRSGYGYGGFGSFGAFGGALPAVESRECDLTIALRDGRAEGFSRRGGDCRALSPTVR